MKKLIFSAFLLLSLLSFAQKGDYLQYLRSGYENAKNDEGKIFWLSRLSTYYFEPDEKKSDSFMNRLREIAEQSDDNKKSRLTTLANLYDAERNLQLDDYSFYISKAVNFSRKARASAVDNGQSDLIVFSYIYMAEGKRFLGQMDSSWFYVNDVSNDVLNSTSDSTQLEYYITKSRILQERRELNKALDNAIAALKIAERTHNYYQLRTAYLRLSSMYTEWGEVSKSREYLKMAEILCKNEEDDHQLTNLYIVMGQSYAGESEYFSMGRGYLFKAIELAKKTSDDTWKTSAYLALINSYINNKKTDSAILLINRYFNELTEYYRKSSLNARFDYRLGRFYYSIGMNFSDPSRKAEYFSKAFNELTKARSYYYSQGSNYYWHWFSYYYAVCSYYKNRYPGQTSIYSSLSDTTFSSHPNYSDSMVTYFNYARNAALLIKDPELLKNVAEWKEFLAKQDNDYNNAYYYRSIYDSCNNLLLGFANTKEKFLKENELKEYREREEQERVRQLHNIQYIGITAVIALIFIILTLMGYLKVSEGMLRIIGFFAFIFLFEFVILLLDEKIHAIMHGEPWKILLIKIGIAAVLLPLHHWLEHKVINYLSKRRMLTNSNLVS